MVHGLAGWPYTPGQKTAANSLLAHYKGFADG